MMKTTDFLEREPRLGPILDRLKATQGRFRAKLEHVRGTGGLTLERYARYLSMQYHLTQGVQRPFLAVAGHPDLGQRRELRKFLVGFANEEEFHYLIARKDLEQLGREPHPIPFDVELWWSYFSSIIQERPFVRLGATCVLENITVGSQDLIRELFAQAEYLTPKNSVFFRIHQHDDSLPHGDQILDALAAAKLEARHFADLAEGAAKGSILYLRMVDWALEGESAYFANAA